MHQKNRPIRTLLLLCLLALAALVYFPGSFDSTSFKLVNLFLHIFNGLLVFWLTQLIFTRLKQTNQNNFLSSSNINARTLSILSAVVAALWIVHPIQVTSVLYVVQRMTSLSGFFVILGLICYLKGRMRLISGKQGGI